MIIMTKIIKTEGKGFLQLQAELFQEKTIKINKDESQDVKVNVELFNNLVHEFKEVYNKLDNLRKEYKDKFNYTDLKLHDVARLCDNVKYTDDDFTLFCEIEHQNFQDYLQDHGVELDYIGRTSSFYVTCGSVDVDTIDIINNHDTGSLFWESLNVLGLWDFLLYDDLLKGHLTSDIASSQLDFMGMVDEIEDELYLLDEYASVTLPEKLATIKEVYEHIQDFKDNQIKTFKGFMKHE